MCFVCELGNHHLESTISIIYDVYTKISIIFHHVYKHMEYIE